MNDRLKHPSLDELQAYLDQELEIHTSNHIGEHLKSCSTCQRELSRLESLVARLESLEEFNLEKDLSSTVLARIQQNEQVPLGLTWTLLAEGVAAGLVIGLLIPVIRSAALIPHLVDTQVQLWAAVNIFLTQLASNWMVWWAQLQLVSSQMLEEFSSPISLPEFWPSPWILMLAGGVAGLLGNFFLLRNNIQVRNGKHKD
jgi:anti-sigma factor RsiW